MYRGVDLDIETLSEMKNLIIQKSEKILNKNEVTPRKIFNDLKEVCTGESTR